MTERLPSRRAQATRGAWWVPIAIGAVALAAIGVGALVGLALLGDRETATPDLSAEPSASATASAESAAPSESAEPSATPTPTPPTVAVIPNRGIAEVVTDGLNLRSAASQTAPVLDTLERGRRVFVIGDPQEQDELRWYRVAPIDRTVNCQDNPCSLLGYVATPIREADAWLVEATTECPASPITAEQVAALDPLEALHCFGRSEIVISGTVDFFVEAPVTPLEWSPGWMYWNSLAYLHGAPSTQMHVLPGTDLELPSLGDVIRVTGHFEDPAATDCRITLNGESVAEVHPAYEPSRVVLDCRAKFAWTNYEVIGFEELGPCCGDAPDLAARAG